MQAGSGGKRVKTKRQRIFTVGYLCPACGTTRMLSALLHLDFAAALQLNPFMLFALPLAAVWLVLEAARYIRGEKPLLYRRWAVALWAAVLCAAVVFAVWRNFPV